MMTTSSYYRHTDPDDPASAWAINRNRSDLSFWRDIAPLEDADVDATVQALAARTGYSKLFVQQWISIVHTLREYPLLAAHNDALGLLDYPRLGALERGTLGITDPEIMAQLDAALVEYLTPTRAGQQLPEPAAITRKIRRLLLLIDPVAAEPEKKPLSHGVSFSSGGDGDMTVTATLPEDQGVELRKLLKKVSSTEGVTQLEALLHLARGQGNYKVVFNLYGSQPGQPEYLAGSGWLSPAQSEFWAGQITHTRDLDGVETASTAAYAPTPAMISYVIGRDGVCGFPACSTEGEFCDIDHVVNHADGGETAVWNLQALCRSHHNMKTGGRVTLSMTRDGVKTWIFPDGTEVVVEPEGPLARKNQNFGQTFTQRREKRAKRRRRENQPHGVDPEATSPENEEPPF